MLAHLSRNAHKMGISSYALPKNIAKQGFFSVFLFTSLCPSLMIDIDCGARSGDRGVKEPCSMVMECRPNLRILL
jgi:hypothetical protein